MYYLILLFSFNLYLLYDQFLVLVRVLRSSLPFYFLTPTYHLFFYSSLSFPVIKHLNLCSFDQVLLSSRRILNFLILILQFLWKISNFGLHLNILISLLKLIIQRNYENKSFLRHIFFYKYDNFKLMTLEYMLIKLMCLTLSLTTLTFSLSMRTN